MTDQTQRLEIATVKAEVGSNILFRFANDPAVNANISTESGAIPNLQKVIAEIQEDGAEKISIATTIYQSAAAGLAATAAGGIYLVQSSDADEIYTVWKNEAGAAVNTGKTAMSSQAVQDALTASNEAAQAAEDAADVATNRTAGFLQPAAEAPVVRDDGLPLQVGDRYFNTDEQAEYLYKADSWSANDSLKAISDIANKDDPLKGSAKIGFDGKTLQGLLLVSKVLFDYSELRSYTGISTQVRISKKGIAGLFQRLAIGTYVDDGGTTIFDGLGRAWQRQFTGPVNLGWYGADPLGVEDIQPAWQAALDYLNTVGGGALEVPKGRFRKSDLSPRIAFYGNIEMFGFGAKSEIFFEDRPENTRIDMLRVVDGSENVTFRDFSLVGTAGDVIDETNQSQCLTGAHIKNLKLIGLKFVRLRNMATAFSYVDGVLATGCQLDTIVRDGLRFTHSKNVKVVHNNCIRVSDDAIAVHMLDASGGDPAGYCIIANNTITLSQGIKVLGARAADIHDNTMRFCLRTPIYLGANEPLPSIPEGHNNQFAIDIHHNTILDTLGIAYANQTCIFVEFLSRKVAGATLIPGVSAPMFPFQWVAPVNTVGAEASVGGQGISVRDNTIGWTAKRGVAFSTYGLGKIYNRAGSTPGLYDPVMTDADYDVMSVDVAGPANSVSVKGNKFFGAGLNFSVIRFRGKGSIANNMGGCEIDDNQFFDCPTTKGGIELSYTDTNMVWAGSIRRNIFNMDPFFRNAAHLGDNTWSALAGNNCILLNGVIVSGELDGNHFANTARIIDFPNNIIIQPLANYAYFQPVGTSGIDGQVTNKGIRLIHSAAAMVCVTIDGDPASATFQKPRGLPLLVSAAMPTTGSYVYGHVVRACLPALSPSDAHYMVTGWFRGTTGSGHVKGTDWFVLTSLMG